MPPEDSPSSADPRELARQLAEKAKARALAQKLVEQAKARTSEAPAPAAPAPEPVKKVSLADRAKRPVSAKEAMQRAIEAEKRAAAEAAAKKALARAEAERAKAAAASRAAEASARRAEEEAAAKLAQEEAAIKAAAARVAAAPPAPAKPLRLQDPAVVLANRLPGVTVRMAKPVANRDVFHALWTAHRARAVAETNLTLIVSADVLLDAAHRVPAGALCSARIDFAGESYAAWVDVASGTVLGTASPADVYLAGM